jgi:hypothetical protein
MRKPYYKNKPIGSIRSLANALGIQEIQLRRIANNAPNLYVPNAPKTKASGKTRQTYTVREPLKRLQDEILNKIINGVSYPVYLQGGIQDPNLPRDYVRDAELHLGREVVLKEDISTFFSSTRVELVYRMWKNFFNFPPEVADVLTRLTTYNGFIPEGAATSAGVANLVFWDSEPELELSLRREGYIYSRYIDDITVSFLHRVPARDIQDVTTRIYRMFLRAGLAPNRKKRDLRTTGKKIHNLNTDSGKLAMPKAIRSRIRAAVHALAILADTGTAWAGLKGEFNRVNGRVQLLSRFHPVEARPYIAMLGEIKKQAILHEDQEGHGK